MIIESKFNLNDIVYAIEIQQQKTWTICAFCAGIGKIKGLDNSSQICPTCFGSCGQYIFTGDQWVVEQTLTIGEIRVKVRCDYKAPEHTVFDNYGNQIASKTNEYMCYETGIDSGTIWPEKVLFKNTIDAELACEKLNFIAQEQRREIRHEV